MSHFNTYCLLAAWLFFLPHVKAQDPQPVYTLQTDESGTSKHYVARDRVMMKPGFRFAATTNTSFSAKIDAGLLFPPAENYMKPNGTITTNPSQGAVVGSIPGQFAVSPTGAATYTIPIECPPGINGMQPNIALVYNSQGGNGIAGWGWNLSGVSAITRTGKTLYHDNAIATVQLTTADNLMLDGQRLILVNGSNLTNDAKYRTEIETYSDITCKTINGYLYFEVRTKDGVTMEYGSSADSYIEAQGLPFSIPLTWLLKKVTDANGNYMIYNYGENTANGEFWLNSIQYTGNSGAGVDPVNVLEFVYQANRFDSQISYVAGSKTMKTLLLGSIIIKKENSVLKTYNLNYTTDILYNKLSSVSLSANGAKYPETIIDWEKLTSPASTEFSFTLTSCPGLSSGSLDNSSLFIDFNNDGHLDVIRPVFDGMLYVYFGWELYQSENYGQNLVLMQYENVNTHPDLFHHSGYYQLYPVDINQDGFTDIVEIRGTNYMRNFTIDFLINNDGTLIRQNLNATFDSPNSDKTFAFEFGDFYGDGNIYLLKKETCQNPGGLNALSIYSIDTNTYSLTLLNSTFSTMYGELKNARNTDINGNGIWEIFVPHNGIFWEYRNNTFTNLNIPFNFSDIIHEVEFADFNADGKTDVLVYNFAEGLWSMYLSTGNSFTQVSCPLNRSRTRNSPYDDDYNDFYYISDFNGDGFKDIIEIYPNNNNFKINIYYYNGNSFFLGESGYINSNNFYLNRLLPYYDLNADGKCDLIGIDALSTAISYLSFTTPELEHRISSISNSYNQKHEIIYNNLSDNDVYNPDFTNLSPHVISPYLFLPIVEQTVHKLNEEPLLTKKYYYKGLRVHKKGKGILGFEEFVENSVSVNKKTTFKFGLNTTYFNTYPTQQIDSTLSGNLISTTSFVNNVTPLGGKRIFPYVSSQTTTDNLTGLSETKTISNFDAYGNPRSIQTTKGGLTETQTITYTQKGAWCPNKVQSITTVSTYAGQSETKQVNYDYDNKGNLTKEIINPNSGEYKVTTEYKDFNAFGQAQTIEVKAKDADGIERTRGSSMTYTDTGTSKGRFVTSKTNVLGETTTYDWDETRGLLNSETTHGKTTYYTYDSFGKLKETKYPDGNRKTQVWRWASPGNSMGAKYYSYTQTSGNAPVTTWFDALGREIQRDTYGLNNRKISVSTEYYTYGANKGRLYRVSEPYFEGDAKIWAETYSTYDPYGRPTTVQTPMGDIHTSYNGLSTTVTTPEGSKTTTLNNAGLVESNTINGKTVSYTYYPSGLTKTATPQGGQTLSMEYDLQGNRTKLTDPDAGVVQTRYNGFGELVEEKQMIHQSGTWITTTNHYAPTTGLLQSISRNGETTSYTYDASLGYPGRIQSVEISGQHKQTFTYDDLSRVINVKEEIDSKVFNQSTQYDALGRIRKETYPSGYFTVNHYDDHCGMLAEVKDKYNRRLWKVNSENAKGQITQVQQGDKTTTLGYDNKGMPTSIQASGVVNMTYFFNNNGNLDYRIDSLTNQKEVFQYDGMNRLTHWNIYRNNALVKSDSMVYHTTKGTITSKSDLGNLTMTYCENGKPHALTSISGVPTGFPTSDLNVTYTDFKKIKTLSEGNQQYILTYGIDDQRRKSIYKENNTNKETRYYFGNYKEKTNHITGITEKIHYLSGAIYIERSNGTNSLYYTYTDYLGSLIALTNESGTVVERYAYDPWGARRNPTNWTQTDNRTTWIVNRGYTMHEHLDAFSIINMNGRVYDPLTAQFFSPDPFVQAPGNWLNFNRYAYAFGNPFKYTDPDGEIVWWAVAAIIYGVFFTEPGYQLQKYFLPVAAKIELDLFGTHQTGIGIKASVGVPKIASIDKDVNADWVEGGIKYYWKDNGGYKGWALTYGKETTKQVVITEGYTNVIKMNGDKDYSQSVGYKKYGIPGLFAIEHYNDTWGNDPTSDKYNTATSKIIVGPVSLENIIFTGEPIKDQYGKYKKTEKTGIFGNKYSVYDEEDSPRHGILALRIGPFRIGVDSERIRAAIQNGYHMILGDPYFQYKPYKPRWFFQFGW